MKIIWQIETSDIQKVKAMDEAHQNNAFVRNRIRRNVKKNIPEVTREIFWDALVACLLTTQQRSGPDSHVTRFISAHPFALNYKACSASPDLEKTVYQTITNFGGIRRGNKIAGEVRKNFEWLENGGWEQILKIVRELLGDSTPEVERKAADFIDDNKNMPGFGPKQARNLLQTLGLTRYEIPIDSRITKWLNKNIFPITLSATALADKHYYHFVMDGIKELCSFAGIYPCVIDAIIFSSSDSEWPEDKLVW